MKVLVLGSGGREHALAWKIAQSPRCEAVYLHPGNAGTESLGIPNLGDIPPRDVAAIGLRAREVGIGLVVIGPETFLAEGYGDKLRADGFLVVGPNQAAAQLETSKVFAKEFMKRGGIPTASFILCDSMESFRANLPKRWPAVVKLDGLAAGKGVIVATKADEAIEFAERIWTQQEFGPGPHRLLIENFLAGKELSYMGFCDGKIFLPLSSATDFKRLGDKDTGPNTGGMGAMSPSPYLTPDLERKIRQRVVTRVLRQLADEKMDFRGILYIGLMITQGDPYVLEFNARFGDPETQAILLRLESDFVQLLELTAAGQLEMCPQPNWTEASSVYIVGASEGYPGTPKLGDPILGIPEVTPENTHVFFSGVEKQDGQLVTGGGRVLGIGGLAATLSEARIKAYDTLKNLSWRGMQFRTDIGLVEVK